MPNGGIIRSSYTVKSWWYTGQILLFIYLLIFLAVLVITYILWLLGIDRKNGAITKEINSVTLYHHNVEPVFRESYKFYLWTRNCCSSE